MTLHPVSEEMLQDAPLIRKYIEERLVEFRKRAFRTPPEDQEPPAGCDGGNPG